LRDFALGELAAAGYEIVYRSEDERSDHPDGPTSEYETRLSAQGAKVLALWARPTKEPQGTAPERSLSLADYLPDDLFEGTYVPHGMSGTIVNLRNRRARRG
jgi:tRNA (guanine-N7-)-methyltransferase